MPWKFVCNLKFHEVLQTTIIKQITKGNGKKKKKKKKIEKYSQKRLNCGQIFMCACECVCLRGL